MLFKRRRERNREKEEEKRKKGNRNYKKKKTIGTKLITNTKKLKLKIQSRVWDFKNTMLKIRRGKKKGQKNYKKYIYEVCFKKNRVFFFFCKVISYKSEN